MTTNHISRREILINRMESLEKSGLSCEGCAGTCCTFEANSMMITPIEAVDLGNYLAQNNFLNLELKTKCAEAVQKFRLDKDLGLSRRTLVRRTYTCPFFGHQELGCPLPREVKPYGCLAFNSHHATLKSDANCFSEVEALKEREKSALEEEALNDQLRVKLGISWGKLPIPVALLELWDDFPITL